MENLTKNVLYGVALGDAIGNRLEFNKNPTPGDFVWECGAKVLNISDDTQMTLFLMEQMALHRRMGQKNFKEAYLRWYTTQIKDSAGISFNGGLLEYPQLYKVEAPGVTCMRSCSDMRVRRPVKNDSKGNGTVMRAAPFGIRAATGVLTLQEAVDAAKMDALTTHKHPYAWMASVLLTCVYYYLPKTENLQWAIQNAIDTARNLGVNPEFIYTSSCADATSGCWVAEEALGWALKSVLKSHDYMSAIQNAILIEGDSDTVGAIAGGLAGALYGAPEDLCHKLLAKPAIDYVLSIFA